MIGHPYTQVLLRREDIRDVDAFLQSIGRVDPGDLEISDPAAAGMELLESLRKWAAQRRLSGRLWEILEGSSKDARDSLQYLLLDRLLDELDQVSYRTMEREIRLVVSLDDWADRKLRFSALAPDSMTTWESNVVELDGESLGPLESGEPYPTPIPVDYKRTPERGDSIRGWRHQSGSIAR